MVEQESLPSLMYGAECWYGGRIKVSRNQRAGQAEVSARLGRHIAATDSALIMAAKGILSAWSAIPNFALLRDTGLLSAQVALEEVKLRLATHLRTVDKDHPLAQRTILPIVRKGRRAGRPQYPKTKVQRIGFLLSEVPRLELIASYYPKGRRKNPTDPRHCWRVGPRRRFRNRTLLQ